MQTYDLVEFSDRCGLKNGESFKVVIKQYIQPNWEKGPWVGGGAVRRLLQGTDPFASDIDVFFASQEQFDQWLIGLKLSFPIVEQKSNEHNTTLRVQYDDKVLIIQAVYTRFYSSPAEVIDSFDYTICQLITDAEELGVGEYTLWDLARKRLVVHRLTFGVASLRRMLKYTSQGFYACSGMMQDFLQRVVLNPQVLETEIKYFD